MWTRELNLEGRTFLHDYDASQDNDLSILELIMTAPMIVTHWINMQYYASTVSPTRFGAGNKALNNVVAGIGCVQGNGHDRARKQHTFVYPQGYQQGDPEGPDKDTAERGPA